MLKEIDVQSELAGIARDYGYRLAESIENDPVQWTDPESIDAGTCGRILLLIELYNETREEKIAEVIDHAIDRLLDHCQRTPTRNYSLYTGRGGTTYVLMQWYLARGGRHLLEQAITLISPASGEYFESDYTSDFIFNGRSGTLLVILHLYLLTGDANLHARIGQFTSKIISGSILAAGGICWTGKDEINLYPSCGFAYGAAGVRYVLHQVNEYAQDPSLTQIIQGVDKYIDSCRAEGSGIPGNSRRDMSDRVAMERYYSMVRKGDVSIYKPDKDHGWADGTAGVLVSMLPGQPANVRKIPADRLYSILTQGAGSGNNLYSGIAGIGLYMLSSGEAGLKTLLMETLPVIVEGWPDRHPDERLHEGLLHGYAGKIYFLLKVIAGGDAQDSILSPFLAHPVHRKEEGPNIEHIVDIGAARKNWLSRQFGRTVLFLETKYPAAWNGFIQRPFKGIEDETSLFTTFVGKLLVDGREVGRQQLSDVFLLERKTFQFFEADKRSSFQVFMEGWCYQDDMVHLLDGPEEVWLDKTLQLSNNIRLITSRWDWTLKDEFDIGRGQKNDNMSAPPGKFDYLVQIYGKKELVEIPLKQDSLLLIRQFERPGKIRMALKEIRQYIQSLPEKVLQELLISLSESRDTKNFMSQLDNIVLFAVRQWIYRGILTICNE